MMARIGMLRALNRHVERVFEQRQALGTTEAEAGRMSRPHTNTKCPAFQPGGISPARLSPDRYWRVRRLAGLISLSPI
jgi:hypothetical protein